MDSPLFGSALLGASIFCAKQHGADECDARGLPLTLHSTNIVGRFQRLKSLYHPNLALYLDARKLKNERVVIVSEWYNDSLEKHIKSNMFSSTSSLAQLARQILSALSFLNENGITHRALASDNVLLTPEGNVKLFHHSLYFMTGAGEGVDFPIGFPRYLAPELITSGMNSASSPKVDIWSLGIILLELFMETPIYPDLFLRNALEMLFKRVVLLLQNFQQKEIHPLDALLETHDCATKEIDPDFRSFLAACLTPLPTRRSTASCLLQHSFIMSHAPPNYCNSPNGPRSSSSYPVLSSPFQSLVRCSLLPNQAVDLQGCLTSMTKEPRLLGHIRERPMREVYYLWSLAGGDLELEMKKVGLIPSKPPIFTVPRLVAIVGGAYGTAEDRVMLYDNTVVQLSLEQLEKRLEDMTTDDYYPLLEYGREEKSSTPTPRESLLHESAKLPQAIKENDVEYQFHRVVTFSRLLESYPHSRHLILKEASMDICPMMRGEIWAALLGVKGDLLWQYNNIDKDSWTSTDRQIDVDIPRCHQYDPLLSSHLGHLKFKRILKSWVITHPQLVYWQGLDSLCAPFLALNFNHEELAYASLSAFIDRFLHKFFQKDNSPIMQEYLAVFSQMIAFHDPELYNHLDSAGFYPELYAIPWFLTMFTHILPLDKIYHLWDTMLLGSCSFPLFVGLSIMQQLRGELLSLGFNECILLFSDMPVVDIQACITTAVKLFQTTPISTYMRYYQQGPAHSENIPSEANRQPLSLAILKAESCLQISAHDLVTLCRLDPQSQAYSTLKTIHHSSDDSSDVGRLLLFKNPAKSKKSRSKVMVVDIRSHEEFRLGHVPDSTNVPHDSAFMPDGSLTHQASTRLGNIPRWRVIIVVGNKGEAAPIFGRQLVRLNFPKVCVLYGGAGVLRTLGVLTSIQDDL